MVMIMVLIWQEAAEYVMNTKNIEEAERIFTEVILAFLVQDMYITGKPIDL